MNVLILTDNKFLYQEIIPITNAIENINFVFKYSYNNYKFIDEFKNDETFQSLNIKRDYEQLIGKFNLIISIHCKQIFPSKLVNSVRCINVHPGLNPFNRGWFPQVFSILNKLPCGVTIHEMDEQVDHGGVIYQKSVDSYEWDTSLTLYNRILEVEIELLKKYLVDLINKNYKTETVSEGNINYINDFKSLCKIDLDKKVTMGQAIDTLRALTHGEYKNAYFETKEGSVYLSLNLELVPCKKN